MLATTVSAARGRLGGEVDAAHVDLDAVAGGVGAGRGDARGSSMSTATTGDQPSLAAAIESTPEPQP